MSDDLAMRVAAIKAEDKAIECEERVLGDRVGRMLESVRADKGLCDALALEFASGEPMSVALTIAVRLGLEGHKKARTA